MSPEFSIGTGSVFVPVLFKHSFFFLLFFAWATTLQIFWGQCNSDFSLTARPYSDYSHLQIVRMWWVWACEPFGVGEPRSRLILYSESLSQLRQSSAASPPCITIVLTSISSSWLPRSPAQIAALHFISPVMYSCGAANQRSLPITLNYKPVVIYAFALTGVCFLFVLLNPLCARDNQRES